MKMNKKEFEAKIKAWVDSMPCGPDGITAWCEQTQEPFERFALGLETHQAEADYSLFYMLLWPAWVADFERFFVGRKGLVYWRRRPVLIIEKGRAQIHARASKGWTNEKEKKSLQ